MLLKHAVFIRQLRPGTKTRQKKQVNASNFYKTGNLLPSLYGSVLKSAGNGYQAALAAYIMQITYLTKIRSLRMLGMLALGQKCFFIFCVKAIMSYFINFM